jgi:hypothetical protein
MHWIQKISYILSKTNLQYKPVIVILTKLQIFIDFSTSDPLIF